MPSNPTTRLRLERQATGENQGVWGNVANANVFDLLDEAIYSVMPITVGAADITIPLTDYASSQGRYFCFVFTGTPGAIRTITFPGTVRRFEIDNRTDQSLLIKSTGAAETITLTPNTFRTMIRDNTTLREVKNSVPDGTLAVPGAFFALDTDTGFYRPAANTLGIVAGGQAIADFSTAAVSAYKPLGVTGVTGAISTGIFINKLPPPGATPEGSATLVGQRNFLNRWSIIMGDGQTESGAAEGSDFSINCFDDAGAFLFNPLFIDRKTGDATFNKNLSVAATFGTGGSNFLGNSLDDFTLVSGNLTANGDVAFGKTLSVAENVNIAGLTGLNFSGINNLEGGTQQIIFTSSGNPIAGYNVNTQIRHVSGIGVSFLISITGPSVGAFFDFRQDGSLWVNGVKKI